MAGARIHHRLQRHEKSGKRRQHDIFQQLALQVSSITTILD
jgi:hypothetical protein